MPSNKYEKQRARRQAAQRSASYQQRKLQQSHSQLRTVLLWVSILVVVAMIIGIVLVSGNGSSRVAPTSNTGSGIFTYFIVA